MGMWRGTHRGAKAGLGALVLVCSLWGCSGSDPQPAKVVPNETIPVVTAPVEHKSMPLQIVTVGRVTPAETVAVRARVGGQIQRVEFTEGQEVAAGTRLFLIDPRPFAAQLQQAEANLARSQAQLENARLAEARHLDLIKKKVVSEDQFDQVRTARETAEAIVRADRAAIETARLQLEFTDIRAPIGGRTGEVLIQLGNLVKANDEVPLVVINRIDPIDVELTVPEVQLGAVRAAWEAGGVAVQATIPGSDVPAQPGILSFIDNAVDSATGTLRLKARFDNPKGLLWPGQFVKLTLVLGEEPDARVVPSAAVQTGPKGPFVFVVDTSGAAELRWVTVSRTLGNETLLSRGVNAGERVVRVGQWRLRPGTRVREESPNP